MWLTSVLYDYIINARYLPDSSVELINTYPALICILLAQSERLGLRKNLVK